MAGESAFAGADLNNAGGVFATCRDCQLLQNRIAD